MNEETIEESLKHYKEDLRWRMIQSKLAQLHQLSISSEELYQEVERLFLRQARIYAPATDQQRKELQPFVEKYLSDASHRDTLYAQMQEEQILSFLAQKVNIKKQRITPTNFYELSAEYNASSK